MNYTQLKANIADYCENTFTEDEFATFTKLAEQKIYNSCQPPALRKNVTGTTTINNKYLAMPSDFLYTYSMAVIDPTTGGYEYLLNKDVNYIRQAFPFPAVSGKPTHYAYFDQNSFILGPTPNLTYTIELHYGYYPESIVTAGTTWLGTNFDSALFNAAMVEAITFMKGEPDLVKLYEERYIQSIALLKNMADGKLRQDAYRDGQVRVQVA
jgi:hypothetical protein